MDSCAADPQILRLSLHIVTLIFAMSSINLILSLIPGEK